MGRYFRLGHYSETATEAAPAIEYGSADVTWYDGVPITALTITNTGGPVTSYAVDPALPTGVSLNTSTGEISGTPDGVVADDTYTITATGPGGSDDFELTAEVLALDPAITGVAPTSIFQGEDANLAITLANMPAGFTLDDILLDAISADIAMKNSDTEVFGSWMGLGLMAGVYDVTVEYNTTESVLLENAFTINTP